MLLIPASCACARADVYDASMPDAEEGVYIVYRRGEYYSPREERRKERREREREREKRQTGGRDSIALEFFLLTEHLDKNNYPDKRPSSPRVSAYACGVCVCFDADSHRCRERGERE